MSIEVLHGDAIDEVAVRRLAALFREVFAGSYYGQYLFYPSEMAPLPPGAVFGAREVGLDELDGLDLGSMARPDGERPLFWHHPQVTLDKLRAKLCGAGHAVLRYDPRGTLEGMVFGYPATLRQAFATEEWENPVAYSGWRPPGTRSFARFRDRVATAVAADPVLAAVAGGPVRDDTPVFVLNCIAVSPRARAAGIGRDLMRRMVASLPPAAAAGRLFLGEVEVDSRWHRKLRQSGVVDVPGAFDEGPGQPRLVVAPSQHAFCQDE